MFLPILRWSAGIAREDCDELVDEEPLEIRVRGRSISVTMRTPGHDEELAAGFLLTEGILRDRGDVLRIEPCPASEFGNRVDVLLSPDVAVDFDRLTRHVFAASSCGLCGKASIEAIEHRFGPIEGDGPVVAPELLIEMTRTMRTAQQTFDRTGGLHAAALFDTAGMMLVLREDVGRHNAVDKVIGHAFLSGVWPLCDHVLLVSGRTSFEILQKAVAARLAIVAAVSAPSSLAAQFAQRHRQTLVGFLRDDRMNIYSHPERIAVHRPPA